MPILGFRRGFTGTKVLTPDQKFLTSFTVDKAMLITKLSAELDGQAPGAIGDGQPIKGIIYNGSGALAGESLEAIVPLGAERAWFDLRFAAPVALPPGNYEFGVIAGSPGAARISTISGIGTRAHGTDKYGPVNTTTSEKVTLPVTELKVVSTTGFDSAGRATVGGQVINYTSKEATKLKGVTGGAGVIPASSEVLQSSAAVIRNQPEEPTSEAGEYRIFATYFTAPELPDIDDIQIGRYPFEYAQSILGMDPPQDATSTVASCSWHGTLLNPERGSFALVQRDGRFAELIGERVKVSTFLGKSVNAYVLGEAELDEEDDISLTRRLFLELAPLSTDAINVRVAVLSAGAE
jgi:hypothetical protein